MLLKDLLLSSDSGARLRFSIRRPTKLARSASPRQWRFGLESCGAPDVQLVPFNESRSLTDGSMNARIRSVSDHVNKKASKILIEIVPIESARSGYF
jgi:hypothetical protein